MTREQMIDRIVKRQVSRQTMKAVLNWAEAWERARADPENWTGHPGLLEDDGPFRTFPGRLIAIRDEFARS